MIRLVYALKNWWRNIFPLKEEIKPRAWLDSYFTYKNGVFTHKELSEGDMLISADKMMLNDNVRKGLTLERNIVLIAQNTVFLMGKLVLNDGKSTIHYFEDRKNTLSITQKVDGVSSDVSYTFRDEGKYYIFHIARSWNTTVQLTFSMPPYVKLDDEGGEYICSGWDYTVKDW